MQNMCSCVQDFVYAQAMHQYRTVQTYLLLVTLSLACHYTRVKRNTWYHWQ